MPTHIQQTHLLSDGFDVNNSNNEVSAKSITDSDRNTKVTANPNNVEFQVSDSVDITLNSSGTFEFANENEGLEFANTTRLTGENYQSLNDIVSALVNDRTISGRGFQRVNSDATIDGNNLSSWNDVNTIYAAGIDKTVTWVLPDEAAITASGIPYPIVIEAVHLGGTTRIPSSGDNRVNIDVAAGDSSRISTSTGLMNLTGIDLLRGDVAVLTKEGAGQGWFANRSLHDPSTRILPEGTFELIVDRVINNITNIATELSGLTINAGDAFLVEAGGSWFGTTVGNRSVIVALVNSPGLTTSDGDDWLVIENGGSSLDNDQLMFFNNVQRDGTRFDLSKNVFINAVNVQEFKAQSTNTPAQFNYSAVFDEDQGTARSVSYIDQSIQLSDLVGGTLTLDIEFNTSSSSGFLPELSALTFDFNGTTFEFPLAGVDVQSGVATIPITIPNQDYSSAVNQNCDIVLDFIYRGNTFSGSFTITSLVSTLDGPLRAEVGSLADASARSAEQRVDVRIDQLAHEIDDDGAALQAISSRISPYKTVQTTTPDANALFLDSTGSDQFPSDLSSMSQVSADNPRFTGGDIALYVAVIAPGTFSLNNTTQSTSTSLSSSEASVTLGESLSESGNTYFVYRVTGLTSGDVYEVDRIENSRVVAWPDDISNLQDDVQRIDAELEHALLGLPDDVVHVLENEVSVTEESTPSTVATEYNQQLAGPSNTTQTVFYESSPNSASGGVITSKPIADTSGTDRARRKLIYIPPGLTYQNQAYVLADDGTTQTDLISYVDGTFNAKVFVPAKSAGSSTETLYPAPATRVSGAGIWQNIPALTFQNGIPVPEADELFFTRNLPSTPTTLTIQYRGHANGNVFGAGSATLANVGGSSEIATTFTLDDGSEQATVEVLYLPSSRSIRVSVTERVNTGLPTINDVEVILSYTETRTIPATAATSRDVPIEFEHPGGQVFAIKPSSSGNLIIVGDRTEIDTGYAYTTLFGAGETGNLVCAVDSSMYLDYEDFNPIPATITDLENHSSLPQFGLFTTQYTHQTVVDLDTQLTVRNSQGDTVNVGQETILVASDNTRWRLQVDTSGNLSTTQVT